MVLACLIEVLERCDVSGACAEGTVGGAIPDHGEEGRVLFLLGGDEFYRFVDDDSGGVTLEGVDAILSPKDGIEVEKVRDGEPSIEAKGGGAVGVVGQDRDAGAPEGIEVPFAEVAGGIARLFKGGCESLFWEPEGVAVAGDAAAVIGATGEDGSAGGRADGSAGVEAVEAQAIGGHGIEVRSFEDGVTVVTGFSPALVIGHDEDDIGALRGGGQREDCSKNESEDFVGEFGHGSGG